MFVTASQGKTKEKKILIYKTQNEHEIQFSCHNLISIAVVVVLRREIHKGAIFHIQKVHLC